MKKPNVLYRFYDSADTLLYVGITDSPQNRFRSHRSDKYWFKYVVRSTMEHFSSRSELEAAEIVAIQTEKPKYNKAHTVASPPLTVGVNTRVDRLSGDANRFQRPDAIACDEPTEAETEARLDELEQTLDRRPVFLRRKACPSCDLICLTREYDGLIKCLNCLGMWLPEEMDNRSDFEVLKQALKGKTA